MVLLSNLSTWRVFIEVDKFELRQMSRISHITEIQKLLNRLGIPLRFPFFPFFLSAGLNLINFGLIDSKVVHKSFFGQPFLPQVAARAPEHGQEQN